MSGWILTDHHDLMIDSEIDNYIYGVVVENNENVYFTLLGSIWKEKITDYWNFNVIAEEKHTFLKSLVWDGHNMLYSADVHQHKIYQYDLHLSKLSVFAGTGERGNSDGPTNNCTFNYPWGLAFDRDRNLYVTEHFAIRKIDTKQRITYTIAGSGFFKHHLDGCTYTAGFVSLTAIAVDDQGTIYVADGRVIHQLKSGTVSTLAGIKTTEEQIDGPALKAAFQRIEAILYDDHKLYIADRNALRSLDLYRNVVSTECEFEVNPLSLAKHGKYMYVGTETGLIRMEEAWKAERFLWIGKMKESAEYCHLAKLPKDLIKEIASHLVVRKTKRIRRPTTLENTVTKKART